MTSPEVVETGSHVVLDEKPLSSPKNRSWAQEEVKPLRKRGLKVQSPIFGTGVTHIWPIDGFDMVLIWHKSNSSIGGRYIDNNTWARGDMEFLFECSTRYLTSERSERVRYRIEQEKRNSISPSNHVLLCLLYKHKSPQYY